MLRANPRILAAKTKQIVDFSQVSIARGKATLEGGTRATSLADAVVASWNSVKPLQLLVAYDHALMRAGITALIDAIGGVKVIAETGDAGEALRLIKDFRPDIALLDVALPRLTEFKVLEKSARQFPEVRIIMLNADPGTEAASRALRAGAVGYLHKSVTRIELVDAIAIVGRGEIYVSDEISKQTVLKGVNDRDPVARLTRRHRQVLALIVDGCTTRQIARSLEISVKTVETYRAQLMERLDIHDVAGLVRFAIRTGLIDVN